MFIKHDLNAGEVGLVKIMRTSKPFSFPAQSLVQQGSLKLEITGFTEENEALFNLTDSKQNLSQSFGVSLKQYRAKERKFKGDTSAEGAYLLTPSELGGYKSQPYSKIDPDVMYEQGSLLEQFTIKFKRGGEKGLIKVRSSSSFKGLVEFEVELNGIPIDLYGRDVTVNWKMYDGFKANRTFWTDSNGLEMQERVINHQPTYTVVSQQNISSNFYPVVSAIAMRDVGSSKQVFVMNDRT